ncbi:MAG TPA: magnesium transporter CorA family protein [Opitutaceae bacterium]|nr:magnesium transporter CorA family protein [Opitutaceae bacterium]
MIQSVVYRDSKFVADCPPPETLAALRQDPAVMLWVDLAEPTEAEIRQIMQELFALHPLTIEDCLQDSPLPKYEEYENYVYIVAHAVDYTRTEKFTTTELDLILGKNFLLTFHRRPIKGVQTCRERILRTPGTLVRGPDRFAHTLLDLIVENFKPALDEIRNEIEAVEDAVLARSKEPLAQRIVDLREDLTTLRQILRPQRELAVALAGGRTGFFRPKLLPYMRDLSDDLVRIEEQVKSWSEQLIFTFKLFLNRSTHETNEGVRVLTGLTAVAIPLMIIGSWFSMNFRHSPLLASRSAYWVVVTITVTCTIALFIYMKRRKWL